MLHVCIIDDGIDKNYLEIPLFSDLEFARNNVLIERTYNECCGETHGTICAGVLLKYSFGLRISSIKLNKKDNKSDCGSLITALQYCLEHNVDVVHMSLGSTAYSDFKSINRIIDNMTNNGLIIVAACNNKSIFTVPACLPDVIGVCTKKGMEGEYYEINKKSSDGIDYIASSRHFINSRLTPLSNSCAAPYITAKVCQFLSENPKADIKGVRNYLDRNAANYDGVRQARNELIYNNPAELDNWYNSVREIRDIENPVVCIHDYSLTELIKIKDRFIKKGYNCLLVTNILQNDFLDTEYINFSNKSIVENAIKTLNTVYNPDLLIVGVYGLPDFRITDYIETDIICKNGTVTIDGTETLIMNKDLFRQLFSVLGGEDA